MRIGEWINEGISPMERLTIAIPKGRNMAPTIEILREAGLDFSDALANGRSLVALDRSGAHRAIIARDADVGLYVEKGGADLGVSGSDQLIERALDLYEPLDLRFGYCRLVLCAMDGAPELNDWRAFRVATKFPKITEEFFARKGLQIEPIKLYGSVELAVKVGLARRIVDLVSTGATLKENGLVEIETIMDVTARLVVNRSSARLKSKAVGELIERIGAALRKREGEPPRPA